ncbi:MAG: hypothetical protein NXI10_10885 [bacterium]|nr:hypothetical protein [bacterium]
MIFKTNNSEAVVVMLIYVLVFSVTLGAIIKLVWIGLATFMALSIIPIAKFKTLTIEKSGVYYKKLFVSTPIFINQETATFKKNSSNSIYDTNKRKVGVWIDGKLLMQIKMMNDKEYRYVCDCLQKLNYRIQ